MFRLLCCMRGQRPVETEAVQPNGHIPVQHPNVAHPLPVPRAVPVLGAAYPTRAQVPRAFVVSMSMSTGTGHAITDAAFSAMTPLQRLQWLREATPPLQADEYPGLERITAGNRHWTRKQALCNALELAIGSKRDLVPTLCRQLISEYPAEEQTFLLFGVTFDPARLADWAREGIHTNTDAVTPEIHDLGAQLYHSNAQNVHDPSVVIALADQFLRILARVPLQSARIPAAKAEQEITNHIQTACAATRDDTKAACATKKNTETQALDGLAIVSRRPDTVHHFGHSVKECLCILWNYIQSVPDQQMQEQLKASMVAKLAEIRREGPCAVGMIERIIDIPTAIDWSITQKLSVEHLRLELQTMAAAINGRLDNETADFMAVLTQEAGQSHITGDPDDVVTHLKRERFLQTADIEFGMLRNIDRQLVAREAALIFPEGVML